MIVCTKLDEHDYVKLDEGSEQAYNARGSLLILKWEAMQCQKSKAM